MKQNQMHCKRNSPGTRKRKSAVPAMAGVIALAALLYLFHGSISGSVPDTVPADTPPLLQENQPEETASQAGWERILVNRWNPIPADYKVTLTHLKNGQAVDSRMYPSLQKMFDDARSAGILPSVTSSYRTAAQQQQILEEKISDYQAEGYSPTEAKTLAEKWAAIPGTSEHQIGLAVDISTENSHIQDASVVWDWFRQNCHQYGFILRYPENKTTLTGVIHEPWHFRYVGKEAAREIMQRGICLEEYWH